MKIQILGLGCAKCRTLLATTEKVVAELGLQADVEKVDQLADIARMGVMSTPALAIDGVVKLAGLHSPERVRAVLREHGR
jgi:small redox-active disulfide protein 2